MWFQFWNRISTFYLQSHSIQSLQYYDTTVEWQIPYQNFNLISNTSVVTRRIDSASCEYERQLAH